MTLPSWDCLAGRSALPLDPGGRWMPCMLKDRQGQAVEPTKSARSGSGAAGRWSARVPAWLVGALAAGGRACQDRPARSLHPGRGGRTRLPPRGPLGGLLQACPPGSVRPSGLWPADRQLRCGATCEPPAGPSLSALPGGRARLYGGAPRGGSTASTESVTCEPALSAGHFQPSNRGLSAVRTGISPGHR
jgi:hypothetical protein